MLKSLVWVGDFFFFFPSKTFFCVYNGKHYICEIRKKKKDMSIWLGVLNLWLLPLMRSRGPWLWLWHSLRSPLPQSPFLLPCLLGAFVTTRHWRSFSFPRSAQVSFWGITSPLDSLLAKWWITPASLLWKSEGPVEPSTSMFSLRHLLQGRGRRGN